MFLYVRLDISVSIDLFLVLLFYVFFLKNIIVTGLNIGEFDEMYKILG